jgi:hypothetical protein
MKCVRSHILKMCYRYIVNDHDLRVAFANCNSVPEFRAAVQQLKENLQRQNLKEDDFTSWYNRHTAGKEDNGNNNNECEGESTPTTVTNVYKMGGCHTIPDIDDSMLEGLSIFDS